MNALCIVGRKDATQMIVQGPNSKHNRSVQLEERYTAVSGPGTYYLSHFSPEDGKGRTIAKKLFDLFKDTELELELAIVGTNGTASMTGNTMAAFVDWRNCKISLFSGLCVCSILINFLYELCLEFLMVPYWSRYFCEANWKKIA